MATKPTLPGHDANPDRSISDRIADWIAYVCGVVLVLAATAVSLGVVTRQLLSYSIPWAVDIAGLAMVFVTFLGATSVALKGGHITVDLVLSRVGERTTRRLHVVNSVISVAALLVVAAAAVDHVVSDLASGRKYIGNYLIFPRAWLMIILAAGMLMLAAVTIRDLVSRADRRGGTDDAS